MRTEFVDGEYRRPAGVRERDPEELRAAAEARRKAQEAKGIFAGAGASPMQRRARASHILVGDEASCLEIRSKLDESAIEGADASTIAGLFSTLATEHSTCPSSGQGGLLGTFPPGKMVADFDAVIFGQRGEEGSVSLSLSLARALARSFSHSLILSLSNSLTRSFCVCV